MKAYLKDDQGFILEMEIFDDYEKHSPIIKVPIYENVIATKIPITVDFNPPREKTFGLEFINKEGWNGEDVAYYKEYPL